VDQAAAEAEEVLIMHAARLLQQSTAVRLLCRPDNMFYDIILQSLLGNTQIATCNRPRQPLIIVAFYSTQQSPERGAAF
jgi:ABC-type proline/glycine betaine transport system ATPase subunit